MVTIKPWKITGKKLSESPIKMLIAQEMSGAFESKETPPSVVAKLMGLSKLPVQQKVQTSKTNLKEIDSHDCVSGALEDYWQQEEGSCDHQINYRAECCVHEKYKDAYEFKQHLSSNGQIKDHNLQHEVCHENLMDKRTALVHENFVLAKRLATSKRLIRSKEFKDALEVLRENRDLFLKFLEEPNSLLSKQLKEIQKIISFGSQNKRIAVLKATTSFDSDHKKSTMKDRCSCGEETRRNIDARGWSSSLFIPMAETISQPTKIVVLKPSPTALPKTNTNMTSKVSVSAPESTHKSGYMRTDDDIRSRDVAMEITWQKLKDLRSMQKDDYQSNAFPSNLHLADETTLNRSENDCKEEKGNDCSNSEFATPTSQNAWVHVRSINPDSVKSCSHQSHLAESLEREESLSERGVFATSNAITHEEDNKKIPSTLGELLAIPEAKKEEEEVINRLAISPWVSCDEEQDSSIAETCLPTSRIHESSEESMKNITRSKSLPASTRHENIRVNEGISCNLLSKSIFVKEFSNLRKGKSFKEKVSSLFFSNMKKSVKNKPRLSTSVSSDGRLHAASSSSIEDNNLSKSSHYGISDDNTSKTSEESLFNFSSPPSSVNHTERRGNVSLMGSRSIEKLWKHSPISVLDRPFQEEFPINIYNSPQHAIIGRAETLSRSPLIGSVSRSAYSEKPHSVITSPNSIKLSKLFSKEDKEQEQLDFIQKLISSSNLANERSNTVLSKSHSLECPLDPTLLAELMEMEGEEEDKYSEKSSNQKLLFDYVTVALKEIGYCNLVNAYPWPITTVMARIRANPTVIDAVLCRFKGCFSEEENCLSAESKKQFVDNLVKKEVIGSELAESMWLEMDEFSKEIGEKLLEELFDDALADLIEGCLC